MLEKLDRDILNSLIDDASLSRKEIAFKLGISESYLSKKVKELSVLEGYIKSFTIDVDYEKIGYNTHAITVLKLSRESDNDLSNIIAGLSRVNEAVQVGAVFGDWDVFVRWMCKSNSELMDRIVDLRKTQEVKEILTITLGRFEKDKKLPKIY